MCPPEGLENTPFKICVNIEYFEKTREISTYQTFQKYREIPNPQSQNEFNIKISYKSSI
jgi:hypothetical protein